MMTNDTNKMIKGYTTREEILITEKMEDNFYYMAAFDRVKDELIGVFKYPYRWLSAHAGSAVIFKIITKAEYETYLEFGIEEITMAELPKIELTTGFREEVKEEE